MYEVTMIAFEVRGDNQAMRYGHAAGRITVEPRDIRHRMFATAHRLEAIAKEHGFDPLETDVSKEAQLGKAEYTCAFRFFTEHDHDSARAQAEQALNAFALLITSDTDPDAIT